MKEPYDVYREMADAVTYRGMTLWVCIALCVGGMALIAIAVVMANQHMYVHPQVVHPVTLPVNWR